MRKCLDCIWLFLFSHLVISNSLRSHGWQHTRLPCPSLSPGVCSNSYTSRQWCHQTCSSSVTPFSCFQSLAASGSFPMCWPFTSVAKVLELQLQHQSIQWVFRVDFLSDGLIWSPCGPRDSQSSPAPQFKSVNSLAFSLLDGPTPTSVYDCWENHSFDYIDLPQQSDVSAF